LLGFETQHLSGAFVEKEQLLAEVEDLLRTTPQRSTIRHESPENSAWFGRAAALMELWDPSKSAVFSLHHSESLMRDPHGAARGLRQIMTMLNQMRTTLMLQTRGPLSSAVGHGMVFDYFDELRKIIEPAQSELFFVDPYLDADFVSRYLPHASQGVAIRLLTREKLSTLLPAVKAFAQQSGKQIEVRAAANFHDRYLFVDGANCYQSGASFKDGGRTAPTTLTQIMDAFDAVKRTYEEVWTRGTVQT
jgi:hypothetical protein